MGVKNLWDILESCKKIIPLHHLQNKRVCIDLSCWLVQLQHVNKTHCAWRTKLYLQCLFHRLRALIALNCSLILVTDGSIPSIKLSTYRRRLNVGNEVNQLERKDNKVSSLKRNTGSEFSCMMKEAKILGKALGIPCLDGLEEAEAQCALLNSESLCDACFTADSDAFLFGARTVYRDICLGEGGYVVCYEMADIERKLGFGRNSLISLAVILGGDYSQGMHGLGRESAFRILKSVGDNSVLQQIASDGLSLVKKVKGSKKHDNVSSVNPEGNANRNEEILRVIDAYLKPKCHPADSDAVYRVLAVYPFNRNQLQQICTEFFDWPPEKTDEYILPKIAERELRRYANLRSTSSRTGIELSIDEMPVKCPVSSIIKPRKVRGKDCFEVSWEEMHGLKTSIIPADLVESACPEKILEFQEGRAQGKKRNQRTQKPKKPGNASSVTEEIDSKLQKLLLDIDNESSRTLEAAPPRLSGGLTAEKSSSLPKADFPAGKISALGCNSALPTASVSEVIDLSSPLPLIKAGTISKREEGNVESIDIIDLSDSENEASANHVKRAKELRLFIVSIKDD